MDPRLEATATILDEIGSAYHRGEDRLSLRIRSDAGTYTAAFWMFGEILVLSAREVLMTPAQAKGEVARLLAKQNFDTALGSWSMDMVDDEVVFDATTIVPEGAVPTGDVIAHLLVVLQVEMDAFRPAVQRVAFGGLTAEQGMALAVAQKERLTADLAASEDELAPEVDDAAAEEFLRRCLEEDEDAA